MHDFRSTYSQIEKFTKERVSIDVVLLTRREDLVQCKIPTTDKIYPNI